MEAKKLALLCRELADNRKGEDLLVLDVRKISTVTDYFVIATGTSQPHVRAIAEEIIGKLAEEHDLEPIHKDGTVHGGWMVLDFFDVIVHIMRTDVRKRYDLERLWGDALKVRVRKTAAAGANK